VEIDSTKVWITALVAAVPPVTAAVIKFFELALKWQSQRHEITQSREAQIHKITTEYLDRALNPETGLGIRHALLRFLAAPAKGEDRLRSWAKSELESLKPRFDPVEKEIEKALEAVNKSKDEAALKQAHAALQLAQRKQRDLLAPAPAPPLTAAALRAGVINTKDLQGLDMHGEDLNRADLAYRTLTGSNFSGANLAGANFQGCDLRAANFVNADLTRARLYLCDLRGGNFKGAKLHGADLGKARVEGADFTDANLSEATVTAIFDAATIWPAGFDALSLGAVPIHADASMEATTKNEQTDSETK
jgi:uncharacterized protein YjbI with pentapeptide repeats